MDADEEVWARWARHKNCECSRYDPRLKRDIVEGGRWIIYQAASRVELPILSRHELQGPLPIRNGFRSQPLNPGKRIKSKKRKTR